MQISGLPNLFSSAYALWQFIFCIFNLAKRAKVIFPFGRIVHNGTNQGRGTVAGFPPVGAISSMKLCFSRRLVRYTLYIHTYVCNCIQAQHPVFSEWSPNELTRHCAFPCRLDDVIFPFAFPSAICKLNHEIPSEKVLHFDPIAAYISFYSNHEL